jgi:peptidoglycan-associated lipoprotein
MLVAIRERRSMHMSSKHWGSLALGLAVASPFVVAGCGSDAPPPKTAVAAAPTTTAAATTATAAPKTTSTSESSVAIDDEILKLCGISADEAFFPFDSSSVQQTSVEPLKEIAKCFTTGPLQGKAMSIVGHADPRGDGDYNFALGQKRADSVASYLKAVGVGQGQVSTTTRGAMDATGSDEPTWAKDRRVDIKLAK